MQMTDVMKDAFVDELEKIAGSMTGHVRSGRRPIGAHKLMEKGSEHTKVSDIVKLSAGLSFAEALKTPAAKLVGAGIGGAGLYHVGRQVNEDRRLGRQLRLQQQS